MRGNRQRLKSKWITKEKMYHAYHNGVIGF